MSKKICVSFDDSAIDGNSGFVMGATVTIEGGNNINTSGAGTILTVNVAGTTQNPLQVGNASGSLLR